MNNNKKYFYLPFATLLIYTFGAFFLLSINLGGVFLSPGDAVPLGVLPGLLATIFIMVVVIVLLFISAKKDSREKNE